MYVLTILLEKSVNYFYSIKPFLNIKILQASHYYLFIENRLMFKGGNLYVEKEKLYYFDILSNDFYADGHRLWW